MGIYSIIEKEFEFLTKVYGFERCDSQKSGSYYYIDLTNSKINIKVLYDLCNKKRPVSIFIYDADSLGTIYDVDEYTEEFVVEGGTPRDRLRRASEWLKSAITNKTIVI